MSGLAGAARLEHRVDAGFGLERSSGVLVSGGAVVGAQRWLDFEVSVGVGRLATDAPGVLDRDLAQATGSAYLLVTPAVRLEGGVLVRAYTTPVARQRWTMLRAGAEGRVEFLLGGVAGVLRADYLPAVWVSGLDHRGSGLRMATGLEYRRRRAAVRLLYDLERVDFPPAGGARRLEQLAQLSLWVSLRVR